MTDTATAATASFPALGTTAVVVTTEPGALAAARAAVEAVIAEVDAACSRFREDSELVAVNHAQGRAMEVSPTLFGALEAACWGAQATEGLVDPTVGSAMRILGYDRDFAAIEQFGPAGRFRVTRVPGWKTVELDPAARTVRVPSGVELDLGATAKAWCADQAAEAASTAAGGVLVSLGGDVAVAGPPPDGGWLVALADRHDQHHPSNPIVSILAGGLATSGTAARRWWRGDAYVHHIVDPATSLPAPTCSARRQRRGLVLPGCQRRLDRHDRAGLSRPRLAGGEEPAGPACRRGRHGDDDRRLAVGRGRRCLGGGGHVILASNLNLWYAVRGSGLVALALLTASTVLGVVSLGRWQSIYWPRFATQHLHRNVSLLAVAFLGLHIATTVIDGFAPISWISTVIPFTSPYRRLWLGLGAVAFDLLLAIIITSMLRRRLSYGAWRSVHLLAWAAWPVAIIHGLGTGTDGRTGWTQLVYIACTAAVLAACWVRLLVGWNAGQRTRVAAAAASIVIPLAVLAWAAAGPLQPDWSKRAGTPTHVTSSPPSNGAAEEPGP